VADGQAEPLELAIGIAHNLAFLLLLFATAGLFTDAGLQVVYVGLAVYGLIVPWWDTATTVLSFLASYGQTANRANRGGSGSLQTFAMSRSTATRDSG
jgi:nicotinamide riboside transporter PnuC